jgi:hypothetical protein
LTAAVVAGLTAGIMFIVAIGILSPTLQMPAEQDYSKVSISGVNDTYLVNQEVHFAASVEGYGLSCFTGHAYVRPYNGTKSIAGDSYFSPSCAANEKPNRYALGIFGMNQHGFTISQPGNYTLVVTFGNAMAEKNFVVTKATVGSNAGVSQIDLARSQLCVNPYHENAFSNSSILTIRTPVFLMNEGQSAMICLQYHPDSGPSGNLNGDTGVFTSNATDPNPTNKVHVTGKVLNVTASGAFSIYNLTSDSNSKGVYRILVDSFCAGLPLAVGYNSTSEIDQSQFSWLEGTYTCASMSGYWSVTGTTGLEVQGYSLNATQQ